MEKDIFNSGKHIIKLHDELCKSIAKKYNITLFELKILICLNDNSEIDIAKDVINLLGLSKSKVSAAIYVLAKKGYILCNTDKTDRRKIHLKVTDCASDIIKDYEEKRNEYKKIAYHGISQEEINIFERTLKKMLLNILNKSTDMQYVFKEDI